MRALKIVTDSAADLPDYVIKDLGISVVPLVVIAGDKAYNENDLSRDEFWDLFRRSGGLKTSQPSVGMFHRVFEELVQRGNDVLCFCLTSRHSGTLSSAVTAARSFAGHVRAVDSLSLSLGMGWQVMTAGRMAAAGAAVEEILSAVGSIRGRTHISFQLRTFEHLRQGGRAARLMPAVDRIAKALNLSAILTLSDGELKLSSIARSYKRGLARIRDDILRAAPLEALAVVHTRIPDVAEGLAQEIADRAHLAKEAVLVTSLGAAMACHGGEGMLGALGVRAK